MTCGACAGEAAPEHHLRLARARLPAAGLDPDRARLAAPAGPQRRAGSAPRAIGLAFLSALGALSQLLDQPEERATSPTRSTTTPRRAGLDIQLGILVDPLSVFMCLIVSGVSTLIHLYSVAYMKSDRGFARFFSYLNFFVFSMLLLVLAGNFVLLIVGWAFVGFASYALISFWYRRDDRDDRRHEGVRDQRDRRRRARPRRVPDLPRARDLRLPRGLRGRRPTRSPPTRARSSRSACCSASARSRSRRSCRSTPGCRTRWRARPRSPP